MWIKIGNINAVVARATDGERRWLADYLTFKDDRLRYATKGRTQTVCLYNQVFATFPTGLLQLVRSAAKRDEVEIELVDHRTPPVAPDLSADLGWLRDYQLAAVEAVSQQVRGILWIGTGGGKTEVAVALAQRLPCRWLFLAHKATLVANAADRYELRTGLPAGRIGEGAWDVPDDARFIAATFQTIYRGMQTNTDRVFELMQEWTEALTIDEAHVLPANSFYRVANAASKAYYRVGLSGTPLARGDRRSLYAIASLGSIIYRVKTQTLVDAGMLAKTTVTMVRHTLPESERPTYQGVYAECVVRSTSRNRLVVEVCKRAEKPAIVFVKQISHGKDLAKRLWRAGMTTEFVHGKHSLDARQRAKKDLARSRTDVLISSSVFQEGEDIPEIRSVVNASGGKSVIAALQRIGRAMRPIPGEKTECHVYDIADFGCGCRLNPKDSRHAACSWLEKHTRDRIKAYTSEGHATTVEEWVVAPEVNDEDDHTLSTPGDLTT